MSCVAGHNVAHSDHRIPGLDGLRAFSILLVLSGHTWKGVPKGSTWLELARAFTASEELGVTTFLVLSGYLITTLLCREWDRSRSIRLSRFYARRMFRIFPPFYVYLGTIASLVVVGSILTTWSDVCYAGSFLWNYRGLWRGATNDHSWYVAHCWSLSLEEQFYLLWPPILLLLGVERASCAALAMIMAAPVIRVTTYFTFPPARGLIGMMLHTRGDAIMVGCLAAFWQNHATLERLLLRVDHWVWPLLAAVFLFVVSRGLFLQLRGAYGITVGMTLNNCTVAFLLLWITRHPCSAFGRLLNARPVAHLGVLSYSLYLWQQLFLAPFGTTWMSIFPIRLGMCLLAAECSYWFVERPCLRLRDRVLTRAPSVSAPVLRMWDRGPCYGGAAQCGQAKFPLWRRRLPKPGEHVT